MFYANAQSVRDAIEAEVARQRAGPLTRRAGSRCDDSLDITSAEQLVKMNTKLHTTGVPLCLAQVHAPVEELAHRAGLVDHDEGAHVFATIDAAVAWATRTQSD